MKNSSSEERAKAVQSESIHVRKVRNDKGKTRLGYKTRKVSVPDQIVERVKRAYHFKTRVPAAKADIEAVPRQNQLVSIDHLIKLVLKQLQELNQLKVQMNSL